MADISKINEYNIKDKEARNGIATLTVDKVDKTELSNYATKEYVDESIESVDVTDQLKDYAKKTDLHSHSNKTVLDGITSAEITAWNNKSTFSGNYNDLTNKPTIPTVPTNISAFTNDSNFVTTTTMNAELIAQMNNLSLGLHTDGLVYLFNNGAPQGNGIAVIDGEVGDIVGNIDSNNNIILYGSLTEGAYTIQYEMEDGSLIDIGLLNVTAGGTDTPTSRLPVEYQEVEYIQINDTGTYHNGIKTDLIWGNVNKIVTKIQNIHTGEPKDIIFSTWSTETTKTSPYIRTYSSGNLFANASGLTGYNITPAVANADMNVNEFTMTWTSASSTGTIFFGSYQDDAYSNPHKWYFVEFYKDDALLGQFIPCYRLSDGVAGFYDMVSNNFYTNTGIDGAGGGAWVKGPNV